MAVLNATSLRLHPDNAARVVGYAGLAPISMRSTHFGRSCPGCRNYLAPATPRRGFHAAEIDGDARAMDVVAVDRVKTQARGA
jgi:hypothetical protein